MSGHSAGHPHSGTEFHGQGMQNIGGHINVGRDVNIGMLLSSLPPQEADILEVPRSRSLDTLLKLRLTDPRDDKTRIEQQKGGLLHDSYTWILSHQDFQRWRDGEGSQLLWIRGDPGKGKTMLLCGIIDELNKAGKEGRNVIYYFCQATNYELNTATSVLRGLLFSLLSQQHELLEMIREEIDQASGKTFEDINGWYALCRIFGHLAEEMERRQQTTYLIVDALDECVEGQHSLLKWITDLSLSRIKVLVSSRNWPSIESGLSSATQKMLLQLELNADSISTAVDRYIEYKAAELATSKDLDAETREAVQHHLKANSSNTFLWVALVCQKLGREDTDPWDILDMLHELPPGLDELYDRMARQFLTSKNAEKCRQVLAVQALAYRPLSLTELLSLVESPEMFQRPTKWLRRVVELCGSFLTVRDDTIYFVHQSAKDYIIIHMSDSIFRQGLLARHHTIFIQSIQALSRTLRENMYRLPSPGSRIDSIEVLNPDPLNRIRYACVYWADHLENAKLMEQQDLEDGGLVHRFLESHLLHWLEALSLLESLGSGIGALVKLLSLLQESKNDEKVLGKLVYDAMRYSRHYKITIETAPLQLYSSTLIFSPTRSLVRKLFLKKPEWLLMSPTGESDWSSCLQTLEGHSIRITSVAFSPNGRHLVSGSSDFTARVWDVARGGCLNILEGHYNAVKSVTFSPNGKCVASTSTPLSGNSYEIRIWDAITGTCLQTLNRYSSVGRYYHNVSVAFPDDKSVISVDAAGEICTWNIATGQCVEIVRIGHHLRNVCVSRNGRRAAWAFHQKNRIEVADLVAGQYHETPWYLDVNPDSLHYYIPITLSSDGGCVAAVIECDDRGHVIQVWNVATGECMGTLRPYNLKGLESLALSPDNRYLVAVYLFGCLGWEIATGQQVVFFPMERHFHQQDPVMGLEFSPDSKLLASGEDDGRIRVWEMTAARPQHRISPVDTQKERNIRFITPSPNGKRLVIGFWFPNDGFQIWDTINNKCLSTIPIEVHEAKVAFSPDSRHLAYAQAWDEEQKNSEIGLFNAVTGRRLWKALTGYENIYAIDFSVDGRQLALTFLSKNNSAINCDVVQVCDAATGIYFSTFPVTSLDDPVYTMTLAFSHEGTKVATLSINSVSTNSAIGFYPTSKIVLRIWDISTGSRTNSMVLPNDTPYMMLKSNPPFLAFSPDDKHIAYIINNFYIKIHDVATGTLLKTLSWFEDEPLISCRMRWEPAGLLTHRGIYNTQALSNDTRDSIQYGHDNIPPGALSGRFGI
ncbi:hypothetical protein E0Z10_g7892 [Xylaria hypoxylon]|uniref:NACHT domain-containing protein n=1 Tax=Xylaria hypoxylon TaxID=37992 RepID=A0A4Z0YN28_9PEZI|nr:hypothetical protein E0Z10_g7892 [Xylaria hypoxylon]